MINVLYRKDPCRIPPGWTSEETTIDYHSGYQSYTEARSATFAPPLGCEYEVPGESSKKGAGMAGPIRRELKGLEKRLPYRLAGAAISFPWAKGPEAMRGRWSPGPDLA
ncbi:hypothetical protein [Halomonas urumqiensis]|uniref:hypothetical protein n=1 Tax=Halomonas urumqiensis TaxID=1684789 RepID=UPI0011AECF27|nr:hypothetical protein [Halomonas urumqiensis]GHE20881.1 hypothetical protein GCM10017767_14020 [Halomonas urumqiensis]